MTDLVVALDLGTTGNRAIAVNHRGEIVASAYQAFPNTFPQPGWVEQDPMDIWHSTQAVLASVLSQVGAHRVAALGLTNQRETTIGWDVKTGVPIGPAIVWQCRRTSTRIRNLPDEIKRQIKKKTGLIPDAYFSASKMEWLTQHRGPGIAETDIRFGTVDSWVLYRLTGGITHATDPSNASRTMVYNIHTHQYDPELMAIFGIRIESLPKVLPSSALFGTTDPAITQRALPITGVIGDQQASLFAHTFGAPNRIKCTYGTGLFVMAQCQTPVDSTGLLTSVAWQLDNKIQYALEGSILIGGSLVQWIRDGLGLIQQSADIEPLAASVGDAGGVTIVPGFVGLGAPYWDDTATGLIIGLSRGTLPGHIAQAGLNALACQVVDVVSEMRQCGVAISRLSVDGGATRNQWLMQRQADLLGIPIDYVTHTETTAVGAAMLAGLGATFWQSDDLKAINPITAHHTPHPPDPSIYASWQRAMERAKGWNQF